MLRDIRVLSLEHNPVYANPGSGGGVFMMEGCYAGSKYLTAKEKEVLVRVLNLLTPDDKIIMEKIINSFSLPGNDLFPLRQITVYI